MIHYITTCSTDPFFNLAFEQYIFENKLNGDWLIFWQNEKCIVVGLNQNTAEEINPSFVEENNISVVRRMTGGGAVYHDLGNLNYSFISDVNDPCSVDISSMNVPVCTSLKKLGLVAETSGRNDITIEGKKVSGAAQKISNGRILHHGCLLFDSDLNNISNALKASSTKFSSKSSKSVRSRVANIRSFLKEDLDLHQFQEFLLAQFSDSGIINETLSADEVNQIRFLAEGKYRSWEWTWGRASNFTYSNKKRFPGGEIEIILTILHGIIAYAHFYGDFMATTECTSIKSALCGIRYDKSCVRHILEHFDLKPMFGEITADDILDVMFA